MSDVIPDWLVEEELFIDSWAREYRISNEYVSDTIGFHAEQLDTGEVQVIRLSDKTQLPAVETFEEFTGFYNWFESRAIPELAAVIK